MKKHALASLLVMLTAVVTGSAYAAGDAVAGKNKSSMCAGCHGIEGYRSVYPETYRVPKIGGQHADYIVAALKAYKAGERKHATMRAIAGSLTEQDMADLAAYYGDAK
jgi:cytochrome c553